MPEIQANQKRGRRSHPFRDTARHVPKTVQHDTALSVAAAFFKLGTDKTIATYLGRPATPGAVRAWRRGKRRTPAWVIDRLTEARDVAAKDWDKLSELLRTKEKAGD